MGMTGLKSFDQSLIKTKEWLKDLQEELHYEDEQQAYTAMRAVLHALRDRLSVEEAANFAAQLPMLLMGVYYENWKPENKPLKIRDQQEFFDKVGEELPQKEYDSKRITDGVMKVVRKHVTGGKIEEMKKHFPSDLMGLFG